MKRALLVMSAWLALTAPVWAQGPAPTPQTHRWRIAVAGAYATGYLGLLAGHGLPRERLSELELADPNRLKQFDVIITANASNTADWVTQLEQFAANGGIAFIEGPPAPSLAAIPGRRIPPDTCPNLRFVASDSPISHGLPELGPLYCAGYGAAPIVPDPQAPVTVLARYTNDTTPDKFRNHLMDGGQGAPAILLAKVGKGYIVYLANCISVSLSLSGRAFEPFVCKVLDHLSGGQLRDRVFAANLDRDALQSTPPPLPEPSDYPAPAGKAAALPQGMTSLEEPDRLQDFCLTGKLVAGTPARILLGYWSPGETSELVFGGDGLTLTRSQGGKTLGHKSFAVPKTGGAVVLTRRQGVVGLSVGGQPVFRRSLGLPRQGALACSGLQDPSYQPLAPVDFADDFMRETGEKDAWEPQSGTWAVVASEGKTEMGVNPFNYKVTAPEAAASITGEWFWSDSSVTASVQGSAQSVGLLANYVAKDRYLLLKLSLSAQAPKTSRLQLIQRRPDGEQVLAESIVSAAPVDWHKLMLRNSAGRVQGLLNGQLVLEATCDPAASGRIGLTCQGGTASFDDVVVEGWLASGPAPAPGPEEMLVASGTWTATSAGRILSARGPEGARALLPWTAVADCRAEVKVRVGQAEAAGLLLRSGAPGAVLATLVRSGGGLKLRCSRLGATPAVLAETPVSGSTTTWHTLCATYQGAVLQVSVDGKPLVDLLDGSLTAGTVGLYARGGQPAQFQALRAWQQPSSEHLVDEPMPSFAGIIDRHTWAGRSGAWNPDPAQCNCFWHLGYFPGNVRLDAGVHPTGAPQTTTRVYLSPRGKPAAGYALTLQRTWNSGVVNLSLTFAGRSLAQGTVSVPANKPYSVSLQRHGKLLLVWVNWRPVLSYADTQARPELDALGLDNGGQDLHLDDVAVRSDRVHDYTFETSPTDWAAESGDWKVSSRWSCTPGWAWFAGVNTGGPAMISTRQRYEGDLDLVTYISAKMLPGLERLSDLHVGLCANDTAAASGYHFVIGGAANTATYLLREGKEVATSPFRLSQSGIHNDWLRLTVHKRGSKLSLWAWDSLVMEWDDPQPLRGGHLALGTQNNGVLIPRVTIFGQQQPDSAQAIVVAPQTAAPVAAAPPKPAVTQAVTAGGPKPTTPTLQRLPLPLWSFAADQAKPEFGVASGLWPQQEGCQGTATFVPGEDAERGPGGAMKIVYTITKAPQDFSLFATCATEGVDLRSYDRFVVFARGDVPSFTIVVKDTTAGAPASPVGVAERVVKGLTAKWQRFEIPFKTFSSRQKGSRIDWKAIAHVGFAMIAPHNATSGVFWVDNLRAETPAPTRPANGKTR